MSKVHVCNDCGATNMTSTGSAFKCRVCGSDSAICIGHLRAECEAPVMPTNSDTQKERDELTPAEQVQRDNQRAGLYESLMPKAKELGVPVEYLDFVIDFVIADREKQVAAARIDECEMAMHMKGQELLRDNTLVDTSKLEGGHPECISTAVVKMRLNALRFTPNQTPGGEK